MSAPSEGALRARMAIALLSLVAGSSAVYLHLYKLGLAGSLQCTTGGCDRAMFSQWGWFLGVDVARIGIIGYTLLLCTSLASLQPRWQGGLGVTRVLLVLASLGFAFTLRLKYGEFVVLGTFCPWCAISAVSITVILVLSVIIFREARARLHAGG
ncbi:MAG: vitamin K epoxide reductase family protein [Gemmatimonadetes bacterium]|nr:vitamin K epoxide reductase family protein [Gemmatimonadota bacterium]MBK6778925.1 vitamin K epoxide reductase family protein [Gemmatimonadota bacterium]MBK7348764.1 vitamin K epoxide reductase family protein [Gemmatimonadota bacterium]MBK7714330.1 vitamin K epoxide reductase family protein [Gemmatimonadota bacterium]MBK7783393.1 vitamin K epoxide reductase family protein [Gemmatimonadota bacterium]